MSPTKNMMTRNPLLLNKGDVNIGRSFVTVLKVFAICVAIVHP